MRNIILRAIMILVLFVSLAGCGGGGGLASIQGYVKDFSFNNLEGVKVDVGGKVQAVTNEYGFFRTTQFPLGTYTMTFTKDGYWTLSSSVTFDQAGDFYFNNPIRLSKINNQTGTIVNPSFIMDIGKYNNPHITVNADTF